MTFEIIDTRTGEYPDIEDIVLHEDWAKRLMYCDMEGFLINEDGILCLADELGNYVYCPHDRFKVNIEFMTACGKETHSFIY